MNAIAPGAIATPGVATMQATQAAGASAGVDPQAMLEAFLAQVPMKRMGAPDDPR